MIEVRNIVKSYSGQEVLRNISFSLERGASLSVIGPSGCGKSTLLYILAGLTTPASGSIKIDGIDVISPGQMTAFILQSFGLLPWKTVYENVCLGMMIRKISGPEMKVRAASLMHDLGIFAHRHRYPAYLSGGEQQRVAIARALATEPGILLMDEPFSSLDTLTREKLQNTISSIQAGRNLSVILVTHNIEEAVFLGDRIMVMSPGPGTVMDILENSGRRAAGYRDSDLFFSRCRKVRDLVEVQ